MSGRKINCGRHWTLLSTECWLFSDCSKCICEKYCKGSASREGVPIIRTVITMLIQKHGTPPERLISEAREARLNADILDFLKKSNN